MHELRLSRIFIGILVGLIKESLRASALDYLNRSTWRLKPWSEIVPEGAKQLRIDSYIAENPITSCHLLKRPL